LIASRRRSSSVSVVGCSASCVNLRETMGAVEELVSKAGGCAVIDGGFATQLEALGADINDPLWSAACLISKPHLVKEVTA
jgi:S-methylmethionine-dependent homocysteine/selenocysteine methylase